MTVLARASRRRRSALALAPGRRPGLGALGFGAVTCGLVLPAAAHAQCAPDPAVANGTTTCTGTDANGIRVTMLAVAAERPCRTGAAAITADVPKHASATYTDTIDVLG